MNRRDFIKNMAVTAGSIPPFLKIGGGLSLAASTLLAEGSSAPTDGYKAIVVIYLDGGNDAMNTFPPTASDAHADYAEIRTNLAVKNDDLTQSEFYKFDDKGHYAVEAGGESGNKQPYWPDDGVELGSESNHNEQYIVGSYHTKSHPSDGSQGSPTGLGIHAYMPELAALYDNKKLSIVSNVGTLVEPIMKNGIRDPEAKYPKFIFSHLHQARSTFQLNSDINDKTGWAGRLSDRWEVGGSLGLNLSYTGLGGIFTAVKSSGLALRGEGLAEYVGGEETKTLLKNTATIAEDNHFKRVYNNRMDESAKLVEEINSAMKNAPDFSTFSAKNAYGDNLFDIGGDALPFRKKLGLRAHHGLSHKMFFSFENTAKMIKVSKDEFNSSRHIFQISEGGYDFHGGLVGGQTKKLRALSMAIGDFYKAIEEMGMEKEVLVVLTSEFGRTMKSNADGTDHGWGGHSFMLCGDPSFNGGNVFGEVMDDLKLDGPYAFTNRARIIPTTSVEQMMAPALDWFGVSQSDMEHVLPNLANFKTNDTDIKSAFLQNVFKTQA